MIEKADVAVIGGGIMGASTAFNLARDTKLKVVLLDKYEAGGVSTSRSAAIIRHYYATPLMVKSAIQARKILQNFKKEIGEPLEFIHNTFIALDNGEPAKTAPKRVKEMQRMGLKAETLTPDQVRQRYPWLTVFDNEIGSFDEEAGFIPAPDEAARIYWRQAAKHGAATYDNTPVTAIRQSSGVKTVVTPKGEIKVNYVLNAAGAWGANVGMMAGLEIPIVPERQQLIDFTLPGGWPIDRPTVSDRKNITYLKPSKGGIAHTGGHYYGKPCDPDNYKEGIDTDFKEDIMPKLLSRFPELKNAKIKTGFSGLYENTPDKMPVVGESELNGYFVCAGWSGHGFKHGPTFGIWLKEMIADGKASVDLSFLAPNRFKTGKLVRSDYYKEGMKMPAGPYS